MFQFDNVLTAGTVLVRQQIESQNYSPSGGTLGWAILANGDSFFNNTTVRGELDVGNPPGNIRIYGGPNDAGGTGLIQIGTRFIEYDSDGFLSFDSFRLEPPAGAINPRGQFYGANLEVITVSAVGGQIDADGDVRSGYRQAGSGTILNPNSLRAFTATAPSTLYLNWQGADIRLGNIGGANLQANGTNLQALAGGSATNLALNGSCIISTAGNMTTGSGASLGGGLTTSAGSQIGSVLILASTDVNVTGAPNNTAGTAANWVNTSGSNWRITRNTSSRRYKEQIKDLTAFTAEQILALRPRTFKRNDQMRDVAVHVDNLHSDAPIHIEDTYRTELIPVEESPWFAGFIAEEADELGLTTFVVRNADDVIESFQYDQFAAVAHQVVLRAMMDRIVKLETVIANLPKGLTK